MCVPPMQRGLVRWRCRRVGHAVVAAGGCEGLQEVFPDETADEARGFGKVEPDGKREELGRKPRL